MKKNILKNSNGNKQKVTELLTKDMPLCLISQKVGHTSVNTIISVYFQESCGHNNLSKVTSR